ncbi:esterase-like activity of phytase family protein [Polymorphospora rubra]|uniref:esterase-like activity of phytase family protein n=1 Tax=Polymorphospora rubra TaxID=338584 RepID=UPI0033EBEC2A
MPSTTARLFTLTTLLLAGVAVPVAPAGAAPAAVAPPAAGAPPAGVALPAGAHGPATCPPAASALAFSDALDKSTFAGVPVTELSAFAPDVRTLGFVSVSDDDPRLFFVRDPLDPRVTATVPLRRPDSTRYDGDTFDGEGVAVLPDGRLLVSSEVEPSIRVFGRDGIERGALPVPARFRVAPAGEARVNGTLEGLSISPSGRYVYAAMEAPLSGDAPASGESLIRRMLVYRHAGAGFALDRPVGYAGAGFAPDRQIGYAADPGHRISEVAAYADGRLLVLEIRFTPGVGNDVKLYAVTGANHAPDVSGIANLSTAPPGTLVTKRLVADLTACPTLGATSPGIQINPLMDNYEGMAVIAPAGRGPAVVHLISDDNGSPTQVSRVLTLTALLP